MDFDHVFVDSSRKLADAIAKEIGKDEAKYAKVMSIALSGKTPVANRAVRVLDLVTIQHPEMLAEYAPAIIRKLPHLESDGEKRLFLKLFTYTPLPKDEELLGILINQSFDWLASEKETVAVKVYAMEILATYAEKEPGLIPEISAYLKDQYEHSSPGFKSRSKKVLARFSKIQNQIQ